MEVSPPRRCSSWARVLASLVSTAASLLPSARPRRRLITDYLLSQAAGPGDATEEAAQDVDAAACSLCSARGLDGRRCSFCDRRVCGSCQVLCQGCGEVFCRASCSTLSYDSCDARPVCLDCNR